MHTSPVCTEKKPVSSLRFQTLLKVTGNGTSGSSISKKMIQFNKIIPPFPHMHTYLAFSSERRANMLLPFGGSVPIAKLVIKKNPP